MNNDNQSLILNENGSPDLSKQEQTPSMRLTIPEILQKDRSLEGSSEQMDIITDENQAYRAGLRAVLANTIMNTDLTMDKKKDPEAFQAQMTLIKEFRSVLNDMDTAEHKNYSLKLKAKDIETHNKQLTNAAELLSRIPLFNTPVSNSMQSIHSIEQDIESSIIDCEPIPDTEVEDTPNMLPERKSDNF